jgi:hypothetical protein
MSPAPFDHAATAIGSGYKVATVRMYLRGATGFDDFNQIKPNRNRIKWRNTKVKEYHGARYRHKFKFQNCITPNKFMYFTITELSHKQVTR